MKRKEKKHGSIDILGAQKKGGGVYCPFGAIPVEGFVKQAEEQAKGGIAKGLTEAPSFDLPYGFPRYFALRECYMLSLEIFYKTLKKESE